MPVSFYELDKRVFSALRRGIPELDNWKNRASEIAEYVSQWGLERFWAMSRSTRLIRGEIGENQPQEVRSYFSWAVAREVLCQIVDNNLGITNNMDTESFQNQLAQLNFNQQLLLIDLLIEIAHTIQFWTMRIDDANGNPV